MKTVPFSLLIVCFFAASSFVSGQEEKDDDRNTGIFETRQEYDQFMSQAKRLAYGPDGNVELQSMIPILNDVVLQLPVGETARRYNVSSRSTLGMLADSNIRDEIELVNDQADRLKEVNQAIQKRMATELMRLDFSDSKKAAERIQKMRQQMKKQLEDVLLPHQLDRLKQLAFRSLLTRRSLIDVLTSEPFRTELDISSNQTQELQKATDEINAEIRKKILKIQEEGRKKLINRLNPEQAQKVNDWIGDDFEFSQSEDKRGKERRKKRVKEIRAKEGKK